MADVIATTATDPIDQLRRHMRILAELGRLASESENLDHFLDRAVPQIARAVEIDHVQVLRYRPETSDLLLAAGFGWKDGLVRSAAFSADMASPAGRAFLTAEPTVIVDLEAALEWTVPEVLRDHGIVAMVNVPVLIDGSAWGVLEIDSTTAREFGDDTVNFLLAAGALIGSTVHRVGADRSEAQRLAEAATRAHQGQVLLREMQHRVKNNFQVILASVALQKRRSPEDAVHRALDHVANRITAISLAHDQLAPRDGGSVVALAGYVRALCLSIAQQVEGVVFETELDEINLGTDRAVALGLILNEAVTNSVKHAFGENGGCITVTLKGGVGYGEARLTVADDGRGVTRVRPGGSGVKLMRSLARQIGATLEQESSPAGTTTTATFAIA